MLISLNNSVHSGSGPSPNHCDRQVVRDPTSVHLKSKLFFLPRVPCPSVPTAGQCWLRGGHRPQERAAPRPAPPSSVSSTPARHCLNHSPRVPLLQLPQGGSRGHRGFRPPEGAGPQDLTGRQEEGSSGPVNHDAGASGAHESGGRGVDQSPAARAEVPLVGNAVGVPGSVIKRQKSLDQARCVCPPGAMPQAPLPPSISPSQPTCPNSRPGPTPPRGRR